MRSQSHPQGGPGGPATAEAGEDRGLCLPSCASVPSVGGEDIPGTRLCLMGGELWAGEAEPPGEHGK